MKMELSPVEGRKAARLSLAIHPAIREVNNGDKG